MTKPAPSAAHSQNPRRARCPSTKAAAAAVARGSSAVKTAAWLDGTSRSAKPKKMGKPRTLPRTARAKGLRCATSGQGERVTSKKMIDKLPAKTARAKVTNQGESSGASAVPVAMRVMGRVMAKTVTPTRPNSRPRFSFFIGG